MNYFAYGSNLLTRRLRERVRSARPIGKVTLNLHRLAWHKISRDGSGKCDIAPDPNGTVWGVVFEIDSQEKHILDGAEGLGYGYDEKEVTVTIDGVDVQASTYFATQIDPGTLPYHWYKALVLAGAREHGLPREYVSSIERVRSIEDTDDVRRRKHQAILTQQD